MTETNTPPPTFPTPQSGAAAPTTGTGAPHSETGTAGPLAQMPEANTAAPSDVATNPFANLVAASQSSSGAGEQGSSAAATYSPPSGPPPPPMTSSGSPLPPQQPPRPQQQQNQQDEQAVDPRVAGLKAMFPDYDDLVLLSVLDSVNGDQERAIDVLLGMSDPNYVGEPQAAQQQTQQSPAAHGQATQTSRVGMTQEELDEQFARQLMLEEQQQQQSQWEAQYQTRQNRPRFQQPARPDQHGWQTQSGQGGQGTGGDTMADIQQSFTRIAETGKKTFGSIFSKVKAKIQEMDQPRPGQSSEGPSPNANPSTYPSAYQYGGNEPVSSGRWDPNQYESRVSANPPQIPATTRPQGFGTPSPPPAQPTATSEPIAVQGYDVTPEPARQTTPTPSAPAVTTPPPATESGSGAASPPRTTSGFGGPAPKAMDAGKLGLLPRKPVSLLRPESSSPPVARHDSEESDGLEYAESPFEDNKK